MADELYRKQHMEVLLHLLTAHADTIRHHVRGTAHNATLGAAAESGVREILRRHLPSTLAVTSGFIRSSDGMLLEPGDKNALSRQTDVIVYDATRACPLYRFDGVEIVPAEDVLAVIEVKDSSTNEGVLGKGEEKGALGALEHTKRLAEFVPDAFRAIVLLQGGEPDKALSEIEAAALSSNNAPHAIYCRAYDEKKESYLGSIDRVAGEFRVHTYKNDRGSPLVGFLRMVVGYMAARGLMSGALLPGLVPHGADSKPKRDLRPGGLPSLYDAVLSHSSKEAAGSPTGIRERFKNYVKSLKGAAISVAPSPGTDVDGKPTVGSLLSVAHDATDDAGNMSRQTTASFFAVHKRVHILECVGAPKHDPWLVSDEQLLDYVRRTLADLAHVEILSNHHHITDRR